MTDSEITYKNRQLVQEIIQRLSKNNLTLDNLDSPLVNIVFNSEELFYAKLLYNNNFVDKNGQVTSEGIDALYH